ncbi:MAG: hypothetical protein DI551_03325 [Micavibrio aeruginosavorus]|uniref:Mannose-6-phosphate isomerase type II C-terminal domain-containing protein n=1 Tax=Micavibrio aeruginosavorus TaxID=349221 RepID=A0A2W5PRT4_9BACT|nr:MAG: hypothetical protein DI551_03325 [Micavibrio aeruginosavorus]
MVYICCIAKRFNLMVGTFNPSWNPHYDFQNPGNLREIAEVEGYKLDMDKADYTTGQMVDSPWGSNQVIEAKQENGIDVCIKLITVKPGFMLSLQRHRGREELWEVKEGILTVILDGKRYDVPAGQSISMHRGAVHCMINSSDAPVTVMETQSGICREKDNVRLIDFNNRPTYPLTTEVEYLSGLLYAQIQNDHATRYGFNNFPHEALLKI